MTSKFEAWLTWIVLSLCGSLFLFGLIRGACPGGLFLVWVAPDILHICGLVTTRERLTA